MNLKKYVITLFLFALFACVNNKNEKQLQRVLTLAGQNRTELEKVLKHYRNDSLKLEAAKYLIRNMPGNVSYDSTKLYKYRPILLKLDSLRQREKTEQINALDSINKEWPLFIQHKQIGADIYSKQEQDLFTVSADYLIENIDQSFDAWQNTISRDSVDFNTYLQYILPYRRQNGYVAESWRKYFLNRYGKLYPDTFSSYRLAVDSLFELAREYQVNWVNISNYPYICLYDYNLSKMSRCPDRCWFNSMLMSAFGIPCAIDYVPAWGNRNSSHSWNAAIINGKTCSFEATGPKKGKWKTNQVYNNVWIDEYWMVSRLPKVFRYSYESIKEGPSTNKESNSSNTPLTFLSGKYKDVSNEYFTTSDIEIPVKKGTAPEKASYAYLFVFNQNIWQPVFWGEIKSSVVRFKKMGRNIVYLPGFYVNGEVIPFNDPFILREDGSIQYLGANTTKNITVTLERKYCERPELSFWKEWNTGARFEIADNRNFANPNTIFTVPACKLTPNVWTLDKSVATRYIRYQFPEEIEEAEELAALAELYFYQKNESGEPELLKGEIVLPDTKMSQEAKKLIDDNILTYANLSFKKKTAEKPENCWIGIDFGRNVDITAIGLCPRNDKNSVIKGMEYELFYWNNDQWNSLNRKVATDYSLTYDNVPDNALLFLKCTTEGVENRIFTWEKNEQKWW